MSTFRFRLLQLQQVEVAPSPIGSPGHRRGSCPAWLGNLVRSPRAVPLAGPASSIRERLPQTASRPAGRRRGYGSEPRPADPCRPTPTGRRPSLKLLRHRSSDARCGPCRPAGARYPDILYTLHSQGGRPDRLLLPATLTPALSRRERGSMAVDVVALTPALSRRERGSMAVDVVALTPTLSRSERGRAFSGQWGRTRYSPGGERGRDSAFRRCSRRGGSPRRSAGRGGRGSARRGAPPRRPPRKRG